MRSALPPIFVFLGWLFLSTANSYGQPIKYLGIEQGLSNNAVTGIYKDQHGFVWIGTYDGLNRYDGSTVRIFRNVWENSQSLNNNHVNRVTGTGNKIFAGTQKGLVYFNYNDSKFHPLFYFLPKEKNIQKITSNITSLVTGKKGTVYIGTDYSGLFIYRGRDTLGTPISLEGADRSYSVQAVTADSARSVWVFVRDVGLCIINTQGNALHVVNTGLKSASCMLKDGRGRILIGTENGLFIYQLSTNRLTRYNREIGKLTSENIVHMNFAKSGELWIGTDGGGVNVLDTLHHSIRYIVSGNQSASGLHSDAISMIYEDNEQRTWIATLRGGVNISDSRHNPFTHIVHDPLNRNSVVNDFILSFCEDELHNLWIGTDGGGVSYWDRRTNRYTNYVHGEANTSLRSNFVVSIVKDHQNHVWVAMFSGGIDRFDRQTQTFVHYTCYNPFTKTDDKNLWKLFLDSHNNIWAGTTRGGALYKYNRIADKFEVFDDKLINIHAIFEDYKGTIWAGDYSRLIKIDQDKKDHQYIPVKNAVRSITGDNENVWIGTEGGGLLRYNIAKQKLTRFTQADGLPSNSLLNVLVDNSGNLWGSTYNGLTRYSVTSGKFKNFNVSDGLQSNQFSFNAGLKLQSGELAFGGINGLNIFYPDSISLPVHQPEITITDIHINNKTIEGNTGYAGDHAIADLKKITIPYNEATIAIDYTALEYSSPGNVNYAYYLENWDHGWNYVGKIKTAYYTRLNEGKYTLRLKATNTAGNWTNHELTLQIIVLPPWYRTWWAYLLYCSAIATITYSLWQYRIKQTKLKYEVQIANLKVEREKELNEKKLSFFTNVSHEFRTPLTLIINPIKDLLNSDSNKNNSELNTIYRNARRLLGLVDHLLLFRKAESENDRLNMVNLNFPALCNDVYLCFKHLAKIKHVGYHFTCDNQNMMIAGDREKLEIALFNLISNALKFTPEGGEINIRLYEAGKNVLFEVCDSGCGIAEDAGEKLFDKFYQVKDNTSLKTGFGIGLYLVKSFIKSHNGDIKYNRNPQGGTTFTVTLPKGELEPMNNEPGRKPADQHLIDELINVDGIDAGPAEEEAGNLELLISDRQSILVIDDNAQLRGYIKKIFKDKYKIYEAPDGETGLEMIKKFLPDVVISDIVMNALSGVDLCRIIKQDDSLSHIPVILLTGDPNPEIKLKGIEVGAVDFVSKPFEKDLLIARVQGILKDRRELQNYFYNEVTLKSNIRNISEHHKDFLYKCIGIIENYLADPDFDVKTIADEMGMSYSSLFKKIKAVSGQSVNSFIRFVRLRKAAELMINTNCNVNEAAINAGFNDIKYFREHFIKQFGTKPSEFIKKHRTAFHKTFLVEEGIKR